MGCPKGSTNRPKETAIDDRNDDMIGNLPASAGAVTVIPPAPKVKSVLVDMSNRYGMEPAAFEATVRATCMKPDKNGRVPSREEFAAFLLVAKEYNLNPLTKEIYAYSGKGGGIVPIVSVDGWVNLVNSHGQCNGFTFQMEHGDKGQLISCTCSMYRKDREHPVEVTEYLSECIRDTEPWKMKHRMLRHKAMIQAARYAFGFSGIYDEDEGQKIAEIDQNRDTAPPRVPVTNQITQPEAVPEPKQEILPPDVESADEVEDRTPPPRAGRVFWDITDAGREFMGERE